MNFREQTIAEFEEAGPDQVRLKVQSGLIAPSQIEIALQWLREKDASAARQAEAWRTQEASTLSAAKKAQRTANAIIIGIAASSLIVGILGWLCPRH